jgi:hypothetical protein
LLHTLREFRHPFDRECQARWHAACILNASVRAFHLLRLDDVSGVSGTGRVAEGVIFSNGLVALTWLSSYPTVSVYPSVAAVEAIHGHDGRTLLVPEASTTTLGVTSEAMLDNPVSVPQSPKVPRPQIPQPITAGEPDPSSVREEYGLAAAGSRQGDH